MMSQPASDASAIPRRPKRAMERRRHVPTEFGMAFVQGFFVSRYEVNVSMETEETIIF